MNKGVPGTDDVVTERFYHGTRADLRPGDLIEPGNSPAVDGRVGSRWRPMST